MDVKQLVNFGLDEDKAKQIYSKIQKYIFEEVKNKTKEYENKILDLELNIIVERQLFMAGAKNIKATKALIDFDKLNNKNIDENLINEMIKELKNNEETKFLFFEQNNLQLKGFKPLETNLNNNTINRQMSYEELCRHYEKGIF
ncbi:phage scaffolding protein [[Clostridium] colinum]